MLGDKLLVGSTARDDATTRHRVRRLACFALLVAAAFVLLLCRAPRAHALELRAPTLPSLKPVQGSLDAPAPGATATVGAPTPRAALRVAPPPVKLNIAVPPLAGVATVPDVVTPTLPRATPPIANSFGAAPARAGAPAVTPPPTSARGAAVESMLITMLGAGRAQPGAPAGAPRPALPAVPESSSSLGSGGGGLSQPAAVLSSALALLILLPIGVLRAGRLKLSMFAFTPLARPG